MSRIRTIKPEFQQSESMGRVSRDARLLFVQLWTYCDDDGRARASSRMLASLLFPFDDDAPGLIDRWLSELERERCILRYVVDGSTYLQVQNWGKHQKIDHKSESRLPPPPDKSEPLASPREPSRNLAPDLVPSTIVPSTGTKERTARERAASFERFWAEYPNKVGKPDAAKSFFRVAGEIDAILEGLQRYIREKPPDRSWLNPSTFLNQRRWEDAPAKVEPPNGRFGNHDARKPTLAELERSFIERSRTVVDDRGPLALPARGSG